jgi:hypothetical protein
MTALTVALVTFALVFGGALLGMYFRNVLSEEHLREDVRDAIKLSTGLIGTMAALVLGLLIASAKSSYDTKSTEIKQITANIILLDVELEQYGPDAQNLKGDSPADRPDLERRRSRQVFTLYGDRGGSRIF